jgi:hypothetical protein
LSSPHSLLFQPYGYCLVNSQVTDRDGIVLSWHLRQ